MKPVLKFTIIAILLLLFFFPVISINIFDNGDFYGMELQKGMPDMTVQSLNGAFPIIENFKAKWSYLYFGYIHCTPICSSKMLYLSNLADKIEALNYNDVQFIYFNIDPKRDSPELLKEYLESNWNNFIGLYSNINKTRAFSRNFFMRLSKTKSNTANADSDYEINHNSSVFLIDNNAKLRLIYPYSHLDIDKMLKDLLKLKD